MNTKERLRVKAKIIRRISIIKCPVCKMEIGRTHKYCRYCGTPNRKLCASLLRSLRLAKEHIKRYIGFRLLKTHCPRCGMIQLRTDNYCAYCGIANPKVSSLLTRLLSRLADYVEKI